MAFIRQYMEAGDPFRFRLPRIIRPPKKIRGALKKVGKVAGFATSLLPGPLSLVGNAIMSRRGAQPTGIAEEFAGSDIPEATMACPPGFSRGYGMEEGDPAPARRKAAGSGPKAKAAKKAAKRANPGGLTGPQKRRAKGGSAGRSFSVVGSLAKGVGALKGFAGKYGSKLPGYAGALGGLLESSSDQGAAPAFHFGGARGGHSRRMNPANVRALRRSVRRLDSFERLVKSVRKSARGLKALYEPTHHRAAFARKKGR